MWGAIELFKAGYSEKITEMGNWSDPKMVFRYIRGYLASEKAMVSFMRNHLDDIDFTERNASTQQHVSERWSLMNFSDIQFFQICHNKSLFLKDCQNHRV